ncbi:MAG: PP2C family protein-serine/threonine phosphatase [Ignavibacteriales bacterium]|nr:PP2C family protein-serine/threonine phosphatase [Ignavibacteriales bacterium]
MTPEKTTELEIENRRLKLAVEELSVLNDLARAISGLQSSEEIIDTIVRRSLRAINAEQGVITLVEKDKAEPMKTLVRAMVNSMEHEEFHVNELMLGWMQLNKKPLLIDNPRSDSRFQFAGWDETVRNLLCVPLIVKSELIGVLTVYNKKGLQNFAEDDKRLLSIIAGQSAQVVENARLYEKEQQLFHIRQEVQVAAKIQEELLPKSAPKLSGYDIAGKTISAQTIGGDYFDFIPVNENKLAICLGDVSGKGLPASLLMANVQATLRGITLGTNSASVCIQRSNKLLHQSTGAEKFVTLFYGILDTALHQFCFCNAGHNNPFLFSQESEPLQLETGGIVLGMMDDFSYEEETITLQSNDILVIYSDGITEAMNTSEEDFGEERLIKIILQNKNSDASTLVEKIVSEVKSFAGKAEQSDDITLVVVKRN